MARGLKVGWRRVGFGKSKSLVWQQSDNLGESWSELERTGAWCTLPLAPYLTPPGAQRPLEASHATPLLTKPKL